MFVRLDLKLGNYMINEKIIVNKLESMKEKSKNLSDDKYISQKCFQYFLDRLIKYINENTVVEENKNNAKKKSCINCKHSYLDSNSNGLIKFSCKKLDDGDSCLYGKYKTT